MVLTKVSSIKLLVLLSLEGVIKNLLLPSWGFDGLCVWVLIIFFKFIFILNHAHHSIFLGSFFSEEKYCEVSLYGLENYIVF